jgi:UrcA family protein
MNSKALILFVKSFTSFVALVACAVLSGNVRADGHEVIVRISVSAAGLDFNRPADAREVYSRLYFAARNACGNGNRVGLEPPPSFENCYERALGGAVRFVNRPQLNLVYLETHTRRDAETYGIEVPARMASK